MMNSLKDKNVDWYKWLEKRVCVKDTLFGTLKYFGTTKFSDGLWCGVELDEPVGKNNGIVNNVKYFTCLPNFGIFVPESKVSKIERDSESLGDTFTQLNKTVSLQKCQEDTILVSTTESHTFNCRSNEEINNMNKNETLDIKQDSEDSSLGLLDPNLVESWDSFTLDAAVDIVPDFQNALSKSDNLDTQDLDFVGSSLPPTSDILFSEEISIPKYASTPRHPTKKRFTNLNCINTMDYALENINEHDDVFENQIDDFGQDISFDTEKFKNDPTLASTSELFQNLDASSNRNRNILSPISYSPISQSDNLNEIQITPESFLMNNQDIVRSAATDLNRTQTLQNGYQALVSNVDVLNATYKMLSETDSSEKKIFNSTICIKSNEALENGQKSNQIKTLADIKYCENMNLNSTFDFDTKFKKFPTTNGTTCSKYNLNQMDTKNTCLSKAFTNNSSIPETNSVTKDDSLLQKTFILDSSSSEEKHNIEQSHSVDAVNNVVQFEPFECESKFLKETGTEALSNVNTRNSICIPPRTRKSSSCSRRFSNSVDLESAFKTKSKVRSNDSITFRNQGIVSSLKLKNNNVDKKSAEFKKPFPMCSSNYKYKVPLKKSTSAKENTSYLKENLLNNSAKTLVSGVIPENLESSVGIKLDQKKENKKLQSNENKSVLPVSKQPTLRFSLHSTKTVLQSKTTCNLNLQKKSGESSKISNKINFSALKVLPTNGLNKHGIPKVPLNSVKNSVSGKKTINQASNTLTKNSNLKNLNETLTFDKGPESNLSSNDLKSEQEKENGRFSASENKSVLSSKSLVSSHKFSYSQSIKTTLRSAVMSNLPSKVSESSKLSSKINISASKAVATNDLSVPGTSQISNIDKSITNQTSNSLAKNSQLSQFKEQVVKDKLLMSRQSLGPSSNVYGIPKLNSLTVKSKTNLPSSRYSMLPSTRYSMLTSVKENLYEAKNTGDTKQLGKSNDHFVPEPVPKVSSQTADCSKSSRIASSLPQKSQIVTRKMGQKYSDVKEENSACPKIPRYNLRGKK